MARSETKISNHPGLLGSAKNNVTMVRGASMMGGEGGKGGGLAFKSLQVAGGEDGGGPLGVMSS